MRTVLMAVALLAGCDSKVERVPLGSKSRMSFDDWYAGASAAMRQRGLEVNRISDERNSVLIGATEAECAKLKATFKPGGSVEMLDDMKITCRLKSGKILWALERR